MNDIIKNLTLQKYEQKAKLERAQSLFNNTEKCLNNAIFEETELMNQVLKNNLIDIIQMIHKRNLKCSEVRYAETIWNDTLYRVSDGFYFADIIAKDGTIVMDLSHVNNDGGGEKLYKQVEELICYDIIPYCERNKEKYME